MRLVPFLSTLVVLSVALLSLPAADAEDSPGGEFVTGSQLVVDRQAAFTARLPDGRVMVFGGHGDGWSTPATAEISTVPGPWGQLQMNGPHDLGAACVLADGSVLLAGGSRESGVVPGYASAETYDPGTNSFVPTGSLQYARGGSAAVRLSTDDVLVVGSWYDSAGAAVGEIYDPSAGTFALTGSLQNPRAYPLLVPCTEGRALVIGGTPPFGGTQVQQVESFDAASGAFAVVQTGVFPPDTDWNAFGATETAHDIAFHRLADGRYLFLANRYSGGVYTYRFFTVDPVTQEIAHLQTNPPLPTADGAGGWYVGPLVSPDGTRAYVLQFVTTSSLRLLTLDVATGDLSVPTGAWSVPGDQFPAPASTAVLTDGRLLFAGGRVIAGGGNASSSGDTLVITPAAPPATDPPAPPSGAAITPLWSTRLKVTWSDGSIDESGFRVERRLPDGAFETVGEVPANTTTFTDDSILPATAYEYRVCAFNAHGDSAFTATVATDTPGGKLQVMGKTLNFGRVRIGEIKTKLLKIRNRDKQFPAMVDLTLPPELPFRFVEGGGMVVVPPKGKITARVEFRPVAAETVKEKLSYETTSRDLAKLRDIAFKLKGKGKPPRQPK